MNALAVYRRYAEISLRAQMSYPASFLLLVASQFANTILGAFGIWALFHRFGQVYGWRLAEVALFYGVINICFALADIIGRGFDVFGSEFIKTGDFDRLLLRPRALTLQLIGYEFRLQPSGRLLQGVVILGVAVHSLDVQWGWQNISVVGFALIGGVALYCGLLILQATLCFWTVEGLEIMNILTYGGVEAAQYPLDIYAGWFRKFLTFVVPVACVSYYPLTVALGRWSADDGDLIWLAALSPAAGFAFLGVALLAWRQGVGRYTSAGG
jgi:ABC-2 type transport system permease protein